jgi:hypothetical protein
MQQGPIGEGGREIGLGIIALRFPTGEDAVQERTAVHGELHNKSVLRPLRPARGVGIMPQPDIRGRVRQWVASIGGLGIITKRPREVGIQLCNPSALQ